MWKYEKSAYQPEKTRKVYFINGNEKAWDTKASGPLADCALYQQLFLHNTHIRNSGERVFGQFGLYGSQRASKRNVTYGPTVGAPKIQDVNTQQLGWAWICVEAWRVFGLLHSTAHSGTKIQSCVHELDSRTALRIRSSRSAASTASVSQDL